MKTQEGKIVRSSKDEDQVVIDLTTLKKMYGYSTVSLSQALGIHRVTMKKMEEEHRIPACYYEVFRKKLPDIFPPIEEMPVENEKDIGKTIEDFENSKKRIESRIANKKREIVKLEKEWNRLDDAEDRLRKKIENGGENIVE